MVICANWWLQTTETIEHRIEKLQGKLVNIKNKAKFGKTIKNQQREHENLKNCRASLQSDGTVSEDDFGMEMNPNIEKGVIYNIDELGSLRLPTHRIPSKLNAPSVKVFDGSLESSPKTVSIDPNTARIDSYQIQS